MSDKKRTVNLSENDEPQPPSRDDALSGHRQSRDRREAAVEAREDSVGLREHAVAAVEVAVHARLEVEQLNGQLLEANER